MDYSNEIKIWDSSTICIVSVKHGLLVNRDITEFFENSAFIFVLGNDGKLTIDGLTYFVRSNFLLHIGPNRQISISSKEELEYFAVVYKAVLYPTMGRRLLGETLRENPFQRHYSLRAANPIAFSEHFVAMANEWSNPAPLSLLNIKQHFYSVICEMYAELSSGRAVPAEYSSFDFVYRYLQQNYSGLIMMHELADSLGIARSTMHKQFKEKIGVSPQQYLMSLRLDAASQLLVSSRMSVDEIASSCGLRDKSYMSRVFKEKYGLTPGEYRRENSRISAEEQAHIRTACPLSHKNKTEYILIDNMGRIHRYYEAPRRIVCLDYAAAEICAALRMADRITGIASAEESLSDCAKEYQMVIAKAPFLPVLSAEMNVPGFRAVCDCKPDIVIGTGYSFNRYGGIADAEDFEKNGIHVYAMKATYTLDCTFDSVYEDIQNLGKIFGKEALAEKLVQDMASSESALAKAVAEYDEPVRVFSFDTSISDKVITCGQSFENHLIRSAGGFNIFSDREGQFIAVDWQDVGIANPQVILVHCFTTRHDGLQKIDFLKQIPEIAETEAIRNNRIHMIGIKKVFPAIDCMETVQQLFDIFHDEL